MAGLSKQGKSKKIKRSVDMSNGTDDSNDEPQWNRPPDDECERVDYTCAPSGADSAKVRIKIRELRDRFGYVLVEFSVLLQTHHRGAWRDVAEADSCHDVDAHLHTYSRRTYERVGGPEELMVITTIDHVEEAYAKALDLVTEDWERLMERWRHG